MYLRLLLALFMKEDRQYSAGSDADAVGDRQKKGHIGRGAAAAVLPAPEKLAVVIGNYGAGDVGKQQCKDGEKNG